MLEFVLERTRMAESIDQTVLATSNRDHEEALLAVANRFDIPTFRGSETDVLGRLIDAAEVHNADVLVRICADNPLISPTEIDRAVNSHMTSEVDYTFNHVPAMDNEYPSGLGAEVVEMDVLKRIGGMATDQEHREHVTSYIWDNLSAFEIQTPQAPPGIAGPKIHLDVDTAADYVELLAFMDYAPGDPIKWAGEDIIKSHREMQHTRQSNEEY
jgi:spore coat polysaccharide biosynthesis protein SpsF